MTRALERIAELEANADILCNDISALIHQRDEALARLAKYEPPVVPDLVLAREICADLWPTYAKKYLSGYYDRTGTVQGAIAGIKAGREAAQVKL